MPEDTKAEIREFLVDTFLFGQGGEDLGDGDSLMEKGIVDSTGVLEIVAFLGERYQIEVEDDELVADNLDSIENISAFVQRKRAS